MRLEIGCALVDGSVALACESSSSTQRRPVLALGHHARADDECSDNEQKQADTCADANLLGQLTHRAGTGSV